jgi:heme/copper-type cytochrome/quinol oxidase subunit 3
MADATLDHSPAAVHGHAGEFEAPLFGAYSKKVGMWLFLASDSLTFGALLFAFSYNRIYTAWPTPFGKDSIINATIMTACLLSSSLTMVMAVFAAQRSDRTWTRNWLLATMAFGTAFMTIGVIYLGVVALRKWFLPILGVLWLAGVFLIPADNVFHYGIHALAIGLIVASVIIFLKPKDYDAHDVEVSGLYWHFVDLVWMFIFPLVYLMSTKV